MFLHRWDVLNDIYVITWISYISILWMVNGELSGIPKITIPNKTVLVPYGGYIKFTCHVTGDQPIKIHWTKENTVLDFSSKKFQLEHIRGPEHETLIIGIQNISNADVGVYYCMAENMLGTSTDGATLYGFSKIEYDCEGDSDEIIVQLTDDNTHSKGSSTNTNLLFLIINLLTLFLTNCMHL